jgi:putative transcriptional regulator
MNTTTLKKIIRRKQLLESGAVAPGRVTEIIPDGKGGHRVRRYSPSSWQRARTAATNAARVIEARNKLKLTQEEFAVLLGISRRTVENWEQGHREPTGAARVLIQVAARHPKTVLEAVA